VEVKLINIIRLDLNCIITEVLEAPVIIVRSHALNNSIFPIFRELLTSFKGLRSRGKQAVAFESYGWCKVLKKQWKKNWIWLDLS
jgi:flavorubredoxin